MLHGLQIPLPLINEQKHIAAILDQADALRRLRQRAIDRLNELSQAIFYEMFGDPATNPMGWPSSRLSELIVDVVNGLTRRRKEPDTGQNIVLRLRDIRNGWIDFSDINRITLTQKEMKKYEISPHDLLFIRVNGNPDYVGRCAVFRGFEEPVFFNDHVMRVKLNTDKTDSEFICFWLNSRHGKKEISCHRKTSAGQHTINQDGLGKIVIPLPPLKEQTTFSIRLSIIQKEILRHTESLSNLNALFSSLQHRAFRGEL